MEIYISYLEGIELRALDLVTQMDAAALAKQMESAMGIPPERAKAKAPLMISPAPVESLAFTGKEEKGCSSSSHCGGKLSNRPIPRIYGQPLLFLFDHSSSRLRF